MYRPVLIYGMTRSETNPVGKSTSWEQRKISSLMALSAVNAKAGLATSQSDSAGSERHCIGIESNRIESRRKYIIIIIIIHTPSSRGLMRDAI